MVSWFRLRRLLMHVALLTCGLLCIAVWTQPSSSPFQAATTDPNCTQNIGAWQQVADAPDFHFEAASAVVGNKFYVFSGFATLNPQTPSNRIDVFNMTTNVWETASVPRRPMPFTITHVQAVVDGTNVWFVGGFLGVNPGPPTADVWRYDTVNDLWFQGPSLPAPRAGGGAALVGRHLHYFGGLKEDRNQDQSAHWKLNLDNPTGWVAAAPMSRPRNHFPAVVVDGLIYTVGGQNKHDTSPTDLNYLDVYNPQTNTWATRANLAMIRSHFEPATLVINDRIIIMGGRSLPTWGLTNISEYNPQTNVWKELNPLPTKLVGMAAGYANGKIVLTGGGPHWSTLQKKTWIAPFTSNCVVNTPTPLASPTPLPTVTETVIPSATVTPSDTPLPSDTPVPSATPIPTDTLSPTDTPVATQTPDVSPTPIPSSTPTTTWTATGTPTGQYIVSFTLVNANTNADIMQLTHGQTINLATLGTKQINIRANTHPAKVGSVKFGLNGNASYRIESGAPYALASDNNGNYAAWQSPLGNHTLSAIPYTSSGGKGTAGTPLTISFSVIDQIMTSTPAGPPAATPTPTQTPISSATPVASATPAAPILVYRINAGGPALTTSGVTWAADQGFSGGSTSVKVNAISNTDDDALYYQTRIASADLGSFTYNLPVTPGAYTVTLHFAEIWFIGKSGFGPAGAGKRVFHVEIEGQRVIDSLDLNVVAGPLTAHTRTFSVNVSDSTLTIHFPTPKVNRPIVSAIEVYRQP